MRAMMVFRQLLAVLERKLVEQTRRVGLTPHDVLLFGWMEQRPGLSGSTLARVVGRDRGNIKASLERLERRGLVQKYPGSSQDRTVGWGLTDEGAALWRRLSDALRWQDVTLESLGVTRQFLNRMEELSGHLRRSSPNAWEPEFADLPEEEETPKWDV